MVGIGDNILSCNNVINEGARTIILNILPFLFTLRETNVFQPESHIIWNEHFGASPFSRTPEEKKHNIVTLDVSYAAQIMMLMFLNHFYRNELNTAKKRLCFGRLSISEVCR